VGVDHGRHPCRASTPHPPDRSDERLGPSLSPLCAGGIVIARGVDAFDNTRWSASGRQRTHQRVILRRVRPTGYIADGEQCQAGDGADEIDPMPNTIGQTSAEPGREGKRFRDVRKHRHVQEAGAEQLHEGPDCSFPCESDNRGAER
jgi:hypothetical protein